MNSSVFLVLVGLSVFFATRLFFSEKRKWFRCLDLSMVAVLLTTLGYITYGQIKVVEQTALTASQDFSGGLVVCDLKVLEVNKESILGIDSDGKYCIFQTKVRGNFKPLPGSGLIFQAQLGEYLGIRCFTKPVFVRTTAEPFF